MTKRQTCFILLIVALLFNCTQSQSLALFANYSGHYPGHTYDLGNLSQTDIVTVNVTWVFILDIDKDGDSHYNQAMMVLLYSINDTDGSGTLISHSNAEYYGNLIYEVQVGIQAHVYVALNTGDDVMNYTIEIKVNGQVVEQDEGKILFGWYFTGHYVTIQNQCKLRVTVNINLEIVEISIWPPGTWNSSTLTPLSTDFEFIGPDEIYLYLAVYQMGNYFMSQFTPYTMMIETFCDQFCGLEIPTGVCGNNCSLIPYMTQKNITQCACISGFTLNVLNASTVQCTINCSAIQHSSGPVTGTIDQCICQPDRYFNTQRLACLLNCSQIPYAINSTANRTCDCIDGYQFDESSKQCKKKVAVGAIVGGVVGGVAVLGLVTGITLKVVSTNTASAGTIPAKNVVDAQVVTNPPPSESQVNIIKSVEPTGNLQ